MATLPTHGELRVLDPGAGVGSLTAAVVARSSVESPDLKLRVTGVEQDEALINDLSSTFEDCGRTHVGTYDVVSGDFIPWAYAQISSGITYDLIIMNPPYRKISRGSEEEQAFSAAQVRTTNLYSGFVTLALRLLAPHGQLVAITPRSFANGTYFKSFRQELLTTAPLRRIHVFERRDEIFKDADVLQENIIVSAQRAAIPETVTISSSQGFGDEPSIHVVDYDAVVQPDDPQSFIHISTNAEGLTVASKMATQPARLADLGLSVSTGRVVDFRVKDHLRPTLADGYVPLVYPGHLDSGRCRWPGGALRKPAAIARNQVTESSLIPRGVYVLVKRFSAKEERRRVIASVVTPEDLPGSVWGFENHLNIFHRDGRGMELDEARALASYLNGDLVDGYVRLFNGHTQINAGDLRNLRYPVLRQKDAENSDRSAE
ncbi:Eco57I restriction-modification methylase domain-containing protein [Micromonospora zamorensis]|uniref:Eco57I restriction-modification methylase domain-containing protein n=1 Tax=Micromonospora zamorensis TaxID=709883 RepID=UPI00352A97DF|nr:Eco57I restriction-modification methylase domain-containing protein [Micromonospora zamorensis]